MAEQARTQVAQSVTGRMRRRTRRGLRIAIAMLLIAVLAGLYSLSTAQLWTSADAETAVVAAERHGLHYLQWTTRLIDALTQARSAAVRGEAPDLGALNSALVAMNEADSSDGDTLRTKQRWADLRTAINAVMLDRPVGREASRRYGDVITLAIQLAGKVGSTGRLVVDPDLYRHYLADAVVLRLPVVLTDANLAADLLYLDGHSSGPAAARAALAISVIRSDLASVAVAVDTGLGDVTDASGVAVGQALAAPLDAFREAVGRLAGPTALDKSQPLTDVAGTTTIARQVQEASTSLASVMFAELGGQLTSHERALEQQRLRPLALAVGGVVLGVILLFWVVPGRRRDGVDDSFDDAASTLPADVASVSITLPEVDARDLLAIEELVHVGRGVRARPRGDADDAE
ncbi:hypothetical protein GCM10022255_106430 [Dactylosporangium darangshiense]|uniref:HAMP domain-containing protein n=2 Tax=Dactylosporangium darangshiense TaxID=579108 RepID=A0ABP8DTJ8_9ACTN